MFYIGYTGIREFDVAIFANSTMRQYMKNTQFVDLARNTASPNIQTLIMQSNVAVLALIIIGFYKR